jgi:hypothetical protein
MSQTAAHLVDHAIPHVPVRQWVLSLPIPLRLLPAAQPELVTPVLQVVQRVLTRLMPAAAGLGADEGHRGAVTLIQRFGSAANLNIHLRRGHRDCPRSWGIAGWTFGLRSPRRQVRPWGVRAPCLHGAVAFRLHWPCIVPAG